MKKKFFSLISGKEVRFAPGAKKIPQEDFSELIEGKELVDRIREEAKEYRLKVAKECESLKENAFQEGFTEGFQQWAGHLAELEAEISAVHEELKKIVVPAALKGAQKIVGREISLAPDTVVDIISQSLKAVAQHKKINLYVSPDDYRVIDKQREHLKTLFEELESFSIIPRDDIHQGGCIVETEGGIINAELPNLWAILEKAFQKFLR